MEDRCLVRRRDHRKHFVAVDDNSLRVRNGCSPLVHHDHPDRPIIETGHRRAHRREVLPTIAIDVHDDVGGNARPEIELTASARALRMLSAVHALIARRVAKSHLPVADAGVLVGTRHTAPAHTKRRLCVEGRTGTIPVPQAIAAHTNANRIAKRRAAGAVLRPIARRIPAGPARHRVAPGLDARRARLAPTGAGLSRRPFGLPGDLERRQAICGRSRVDAPILLEVAQATELPQPELTAARVPVEVAAVSRVVPIASPHHQCR